MNNTIDKELSEFDVQNKPKKYIKIKINEEQNIICNSFVLNF